MTWFNFIQTLLEAKVKFSNDPVTVVVNQDDVIMSENDVVESNADPIIDFNAIPQSQSPSHMDAEEQPLQQTLTQQPEPNGQSTETQSDNPPAQVPVELKSRARKRAISNTDKRTTRSTTEPSNTQKNKKLLSGSLVELLTIEESDDEDDEMIEDGVNGQDTNAKELIKQKNAKDVDDFEASLELFLQQLDTTTPYTELIKLTLNWFLGTSPQSWSTDPLILATHLITNQEQFSTEHTLILAGLYLFEQKSVDHPEYFIRARRLINQLNLIGIKSHLNEEEIKILGSPLNKSLDSITSLDSLLIDLENYKLQTNGFHIVVN